MTRIKETSYPGHQFQRHITQDTEFRDFLPRTPIKKPSYTGHQLKSLLTQDTN